MLSMEDIAAIKFAVEMCNDSEVKKEILTFSGSGLVIKETSEKYIKQQWDERVEKKSVSMLNNIGLPKHLQEKVTGNVLLTGMRMLTWAKYHERFLGFSLEYSINILNSCFFTSRGIIDNKKVAEELMSDTDLSIKQKYKLACLYCLKDHIPVLYSQIFKQDKEEFSDAQIRAWVNQPRLVALWTICMIGKEDRNIDLYMLEAAVEIGSKAAVEYCLESTSLRNKKDVIPDTAMKIVRKLSPVIQDEWVVFQCTTYINAGSWIPSDNYRDILTFLLSKMREDQKIKFLNADIEDFECKRHFNDRRYSRVLEYFLNWPYNYYFGKMAGLMWEFLPEINYAALLFMICEKIESPEWKTLVYAEEKCYDYRALLMEFWNQSPKHYKRYLFSNQKVDHRIDRLPNIETGLRLLHKILTLKKFTYEDMENVRLISDSAEDKESIISSENWKCICTRLIELEKFKILDRFVAIYFLSKEKENKFKCELSFTKKVQCIYINFVKNEKWNAADWLINWSSLSKVEINKLKKEMIYSEDGSKACLDLVSCDKGVIAVAKFVRWYFNSEEETKAFKKELIFSYSGVHKCSDLVVQNKLDLVNEFISFSLSSEKDIRKLKETVAYKTGHGIFKELFPGYFGEKFYNKTGYFFFIRLIRFIGDQGEKAENFLNWCFSSKDEARQFKTKGLLKQSCAEIHFQLIKLNDWKGAEAFFAWLKLSAEEIKALKKETLYCDEASQMFKEMMDTEDNERFAFYGGTQKAIELYSKWFLTDKETILEFKDQFKRQYRNITEKDEVALKKFDLMIEQRLKDLDKEQ